MSTRSQLTKDLNDSVTALLGKRIKILFKNVVRLETKSDKTENRLLVFSPCRLFILTAKVPTRIDCHFHYLEIKGIETRKGNHLCFLISDKWYSFLCSNDSEVQAMLTALSTALQVIFPGVSLPEVIDGPVSVDCQYDKCIRTGCSAPCGAFSTQYACMCDYHTLPYREEVAWDIDRIYASHGTRELSLRDFDHLEPKDLVPLVSALEHNLWFHSLRASALKLTHEALDRLLHVLSRTSNLQSIHLNHLTLKHEMVGRLSHAIQNNPNTSLHTIDLSNNLIEDKSIPSINAILTKIVQNGREGLKRLELSGCGLSTRGISSLTQTLASLKPLTLTHLNLSHNIIRDEISGLCSLLAEPNNISHLDISSTETVLDSVFGALLRGCTAHLSYLDVSRNCFSLKKSSREMPPSFKQFFTASLTLKYLNFSHCKLPMEPLKNLLLGLACNESTAGLELDLSSNCLGSHGAHVLESCIHGVAAISSLDISDNGLEGELGGVMTAVGRNKSITHLKISKNLAGMKTKHVAPVIEALVHTIQEDDCVLEKLNVSDCKMKTEIYPLINALGSNHCLTHIDISGNAVGDSGARLLAKALQTNNKLKTIVLDRNNLTINGYSEIAYALSSNTSLVYLGPLVHDMMSCMKLSLERTEQVMTAISEALYRNTMRPTPRAKQTSHNRWSTQEHMLDRVVLSAKDSLQAHQNADTENNEAAPVSLTPHQQYTNSLITDAANAKQLRCKLSETIEESVISTAVEGRLNLTSRDIQALVQSHIEASVERMLTAGSELMPTVLSDTFKSSLRSKVCNKALSQVPSKVTSALPPSKDIVTSANELCSSLALQLAERITEEAIELLSKAQYNLNGDKRSSTPDVLRTMPRQASDPTHPFATPQLMSRRKSCFGRKLRPNSVTDTFSAEHIPDLLPSITSPQDGLDWESLDSVCETAGQRLQHLVKGRPRRVKTRAPSRPTNHKPHHYLLTDTDECDTDNQSTISEASSVATPKPRPWSALCNDKSVSEGYSETSTATNTPDSTDPPSLNSISESVGERKVCDGSLTKPKSAQDAPDAKVTSTS